MRTVFMCSSIFQVPQRRIHSLTDIWWQKVGQISSGVDGCNTRTLFACACGSGDGPRRRWNRQPTPSKSEGRNKSTLSSSTPNIAPGLSGEFATSTKLSVAEMESAPLEEMQHPDLRLQSPETKALASNVTFFVMDIETTGFSRKDSRIIEIAIRDLRGGRNSTFQTLINPECFVPNAHIHGITTRMVNRPDIPRMKELIPILTRYIRSRQKPGGHAVLIAHNARSFDIPFLIREFQRCSCEIPLDWLFLDTVPLAREAMKIGNGSKPSPKVSLQALREHYEIPLTGRAHRAMADVDLLAMVFKRITFDLKLLTPTILGRCFRASDVN